jgi:hypothetical protein
MPQRDRERDKSKGKRKGPVGVRAFALTMVNSNATKAVHHRHAAGHSDEESMCQWRLGVPRMESCAWREK